MNRGFSISNVDEDPNKMMKDVLESKNFQILSKRIIAEKQIRVRVLLWFVSADNYIQKMNVKIILHLY